MNRKRIQQLWKLSGGYPDQPLGIPGRELRSLLLMAGIGMVLAGAALGLWIWREGEILTLREQNAVQHQQIEQIQQKTAELDEKMKQLDILDQELRQMIKGAESGTVPQGGGSLLLNQAEKEQPLTDDPQELLIQAGTLETKINARLISFVTLRTILQDTAGQRIGTFQRGFGILADSSQPSIWPARGYISSEYGSRVSPIEGASSYHEGIDIAVEYGSPVQATAKGVVTYAGWADGYGNLVEVDHGNGIKTRYGHNSVLTVTEGQTVKTGDIVALAGSTGRSTGSHCHYEVRVEGSSVNPRLFLPTE